MPIHGKLVFTYYSGEGRNKSGCVPDVFLRQALCAMTVIDEDAAIRDEDAEVPLDDDGEQWWQATPTGGRAALPAEQGHLDQLPVRRHGTRRERWSLRVVTDHPHATVTRTAVALVVPCQFVRVRLSRANNLYVTPVVNTQCGRWLR
eukprot:gene19613-23769_t